MFCWTCVAFGVLPWSWAQEGVVSLGGDGVASCFGVALDFNLLLTTSSCAQATKFVTYNGETRQVEKVMRHPRGRRFFAARRDNTPHRLAVVRVKDDCFDAFFTLMSVNTGYLLGAQVQLATVARTATSKLKTIMFCMFELKGSGDEYICTTSDRTENCSWEGLPLFKDKHVIALSDKQRVCSIQRAFVAVGSSIAWINYVLRYNFKTIYHRIGTRSLKANVASHLISTRAEHIARTTVSAVSDRNRAKVMKVKSNYKKTTVLKRNVSKTLAVSRKKRKSRILFKTSLNVTEKRKVSRSHRTATHEKRLIAVSYKEHTKKEVAIKKAIATRKTKIARTNRSREATSRTYRTSPIVDQPTTEKSLASSTQHALKPNTQQPCTTTHSSIQTYKTSRATSFESNKKTLASRAGNLSRLYEATTTALDWFKDRLQQKLKKGSLPVLMLTTSRATEAFVDLT